MNNNFPSHLPVQNGHNSSAREDQHHGTTEHDAVNQRFLEREAPPEQANCLSCGGSFLKGTIADVIKHYADQAHPQFYSPCLYCKGKIHRYRDGKGVQFYHDCYRSTKMLDQ